MAKQLCINGVVHDVTDESYEAYFALRDQQAEEDGRDLPVSITFVDKDGAQDGAQDGPHLTDPKDITV
jgi:hypothetical protein